MHFVQKIKHKQVRLGAGLSPLALLTLAACGGGGGGGQSGGGGGSFSVGGNVIKGPLSNALVGLDYNGDGVVDSTTVRTGTDGSYSITTSNSTYTVIAVTDEQTVDASSGTVLSGVTLKAPKGASVVTPTTTLMEEGGLTSEQVASVLGLPDGVDPTNFNPYASNVDPDQALAVEKTSQQVINVVNSFAAAAEGAGASEVDAFKAALNSVAEVVKTKVEKLNDLTASEADKSLDLTSEADLTLIKTQVKTEITSTANVNSTAFNTLADDTTTAIKNVNNKIETVTDLTSDASKNIFSTTQVLADQVKTATTAEVGDVGTGNISFTDANVVNTAAINKAPTNITLSSNSVSETATSLVIGTLSTTDTDQSSGVAFIYKIAEVTGTDFSSFNINQITGELSLLAQPDFETKASYNLTVLSTDEGGKTSSKSFIINVADVNEAPTVANAISNQTIAEGSALKFQLASNVFSDVDSGDTLTYAATLSSGANLPSWLNFDEANKTFSGTPVNADVGTIEVKITATDSETESVSDNFSIEVLNVSNAAEGPVSILGTAVEGQTLNAVSEGIKDADGLGAFSYQWYASGLSLVGETNPNLLLNQNHVNKDISVSVSFTDGEGTFETVSSVASSLVTNINDLPQGQVVITGDPIEDGVISSDVSNIVDEDGLGVFNYQWQRDEANIVSATGTSYTMGDDDVGKAIRLSIKYTDQYGAEEFVYSLPTELVKNVNDIPVLTTQAAISTTEDIPASSIVFSAIDLDNDQLSFTFSEPSNGTILNNGNKSYTYTPSVNFNGSDSFSLSVYDGTVTVSETINVTVGAVNDAPVLNTLTVLATDEDNAITNILFSASDPENDALTYVLGTPDKGTVVNNGDGTYTYTPDLNKNGTDSFNLTVSDGAASDTESIVLTIAPVNDVPSGNLSISGHAFVGQTLRLVDTVSDPDGMTNANKTFEWYRGTNKITDQVSSTYVIQTEDIGQTVTGKMSFTDNDGTLEAVTSSPTAAVINPALDIYLKSATTDNVTLGVKVNDTNISSLGAMNLKVDYDESILNTSSNPFTFISGATALPGAKNSQNGTFEAGFMAYPDVKDFETNDLFTFEANFNSQGFTGSFDIALIDISLGAQNDIPDVYESFII